MPATSVSGPAWTDDTGTAANPNLDGTVINNARRLEIYTAFNNAFAADFTFGGDLAVEGFGTHSFSASGTGGNILLIRNTSAGTTNFGELQVGNNGSADAGKLRHTSSTFTATGIYPQDGFILEGERAGGLVLAATHASGTMKFYAGGTTLVATLGTALTFSAANTRSIVISPTSGVAGIQLTGAGGSGKAYALISGTDGSFLIQDDSDAHPRINFDAGGTVQLYVGGGTEFRFHNDGLLCINDTGNINMVQGLTVNCGTNDNEIVCLKSSDVGHGMTGQTEADSFGFMKKKSATLGGLQIVGLAESGSPHCGLELGGYASSTDGTKGTGGVGAVIVNAALYDGGTGITTIGSNANLAVFRDNGTTRFILDADGDSHQDVGTAWTNFHGHDDVSLIHQLAAHVSRRDDPIRRSFGRWLKTSRTELERLKLVTFNKNGRHFVNMSKLTMLLVGAIQQQHQRITTLERRLLEVS
jgi:hypothetical protein